MACGEVTRILPVGIARAAMLYRHETPAAKFSRSSTSTARRLSGAAGDGLSVSSIRPPVSLRLAAG